MTSDRNEIQQEARQILDTLAFLPFEDCQPLSREFETIPSPLGLYAFRHRTGGHKAFLWGWLDEYDPNDVRIAFKVIQQWQSPGLSYELETLILQATNPP